MIPMTIRRFWIAFVSIAMLPSVLASAQKAGDTAEMGKIPLTQVLMVAAPYPNLRQSVKLALISAGQDKAAIQCTGTKLGVAWGALALRTIGPYRCVIGQRTLMIATQPVFYSAGGHRLVVTDKAQLGKASRVVESRLQWTWK
jgi:hypothetical protein